jgi:hypothetical protein
MRVGEIHPATMHHIKLMQHYNRLAVERAVIERIKENVKHKEKLRVQEASKGLRVDVMV